MATIDTSSTAAHPAATKPKSNKLQRRMARQPKDEAAPARSPPVEASSTVSPSPAPRPGSKSAEVVALLQREQGATLAEMIGTTGWLPHTTRAALTGLKKKGHVIAKDKRGDVTCYRITAAA